MYPNSQYRDDLTEIYETSLDGDLGEQRAIGDKVYEWLHDDYPNARPVQRPFVTFNDTLPRKGPNVTSTAFSISRLEVTGNNPLEDQMNEQSTTFRYRTPLNATFTENLTNANDVMTKKKVPRKRPVCCSIRRWRCYVQNFLVYMAFAISVGIFMAGTWLIYLITVDFNNPASSQYILLEPALNFRPKPRDNDWGTLIQYNRRDRKAIYELMDSITEVVESWFDFDFYCFVVIFAINN